MYNLVSLLAISYANVHSVYTDPIYHLNEDFS